MTGLVLRGGDVLDARRSVLERRDVRLVDGRVSGDPAADGDRVVDVAGLVVAPGLVDLHCHLFVGQDLGIDPDVVGPPSGTTTFVDAGSAGGHLFGAFRRATLERTDLRVRAFVNIASIGTTSILLRGELKSPEYADVEVAVDAIEANRDVVVGVKVRASADVGGEHAPEGLRRARAVADRVGLPLMVHLGPAPASLDEILDALGPGDILTHSLSGWPGNSVYADGVVRPAVLAARARGVLLDVGHGMSGFDAAVGRGMVEAGQAPDTISTDLHTYSESRVIDLPTVLSKFLSFGLPLPDALARATLAPARAIGLDADGVGTLDPGAPADVAVLRLADGPVTLGMAGTPGYVEADRRLDAVLTIAGGAVAFDPEGRA